MRSDQQGEVGLLLLIASAQPVRVVMVVVVLVGALARHTLTLGEAGHLDLLAVISGRVDGARLQLQRGQHVGTILSSSRAGRLQNTLSERERDQQEERR